MKETRMAPVFISPGEGIITVFGGGAVALRKCLHFEGFRIRAVSERFLPELKDVAEECIETVLDEDNCERYMEGAFIVIAATGSRDLNRKISEQAKARGILVNSSHGGGDVLIPSVLRREGFTVTVSSEGKAPVFPPYVISKIDCSLGPEYDDMLRLLSRIRPEIMGIIGSQTDRAGILSRIIRNEDVWNSLRSGDRETAYELMRREAGL